MSAPGNSPGSSASGIGDGNPPSEFDLPQLLQRFYDTFGKGHDQGLGEPLCFFAPGRVNLIGEHTDYTGGLVFPCGIDRGTVLIIRRTHRHRYRFASTNFDAMAELSKDEIGQTYGDTWINYPLGVLDQFTRHGVALTGVDCLFSGNIPNGAGLSSSASIEVVTAMALNELHAVGLSTLELVHVAMRAENDFVGMQCGIMDQFAVAMARRDHAVMLDCATLDYRQVPLELGDYRLVIANTNQRRELSESAYNMRVAECRRALSLLQARVRIGAMGELSEEALDANLDLFDDDPIALCRATHLATENARVRAAVPALESGDLAGFGELMNASHISLRDAFEVSSEPLDELVRLALREPDVLGSRMTGAGFGGCTVSLVPATGIERFVRSVGPGYQAATGLTADFLTVLPGAGVHRVPLPA